ncbi:hypothetical protein DL768_011755 [Monosporascus sp. mg162]|nr:hypothetical protein DL768_011755 [Monosporascus sp. mg162]
MQCYVTYEVNNGQFIFKKRSAVASSGPGLKMFWNEPSTTEVRDREGNMKEEVSFAENPLMKSMVDEYFRQIEWTLRRLSS